MRIEYEDREVLVVYKEAGVPVQTGRTSRRDLVSLLKNHLADGSGEPYLGIVHRLDQPVEGLLVFAKTPQGAAFLSAQAASKDGDGMEKIYQAVVCLDAFSYPTAIEGMKKEVTLTDWLGRDRVSNLAYVTAEGEEGAKWAKLAFRTKWIRESRALVEIHLYTGRHHQIRIQMAHAHMPLLGDRKYGVCGEGEAAVPLCLCASQLSFIHPGTKKRMTFRVLPAWLPQVSKGDNMGETT